MKLDYSEFSYGYAFTENLIRWASATPGGAPFFPNLIQEGQLGYDVRIDFPSCPLYFQFKLPELMVRDTAAEISKHFLHGISTPFFRMHLIKSSLSRQHQLLIDLESRHPNSVYYTAPGLQCNQSFNAAYNSAAVHFQSVFFSPGEIGPLPDDNTHVVSYRYGLPYAWFRSEPREIRAFRFEDVVDQLGNLSDESRYGSLRDMARTTLEELMLLAPQEFRYSESAIRQRIRKRRATIGDVLELDEAKMGVIEDLLVSREIARVALGLEFVVAQPLG